MTSFTPLTVDPAASLDPEIRTEIQQAAEFAAAADEYWEICEQRENLASEALAEASAAYAEAASLIAVAGRAQTLAHHKLATLTDACGLIITADGIKARPAPAPAAGPGSPATRDRHLSELMLPPPPAFDPADHVYQPPAAHTSVTDPCLRCGRIAANHGPVQA
jgi:hypothetical protein